MALKWVILSLIGCMTLPEISGHARLMDPPARSTMWRFGFNTPINYDDNGLNCGGFNHQWNVMNGLCGTCGDPWDQYPRSHEPPYGLYATGTIGKTYDVGQRIRVTVQITAHHKGWFEFRLCPHNDVTTPVTQACLDNHLLPLYNNGGTRYLLPNWGAGNYYVDLQLPSGLSCTQCVLQWKYNAGNNWGCEGVYCAVGLGPQEQFYGCADISIGNYAALPPANPTETPPPPPPPPPPSSQCRAVPPYDAVPGYDEWCVINCAAGYCPAGHCTCA